MATMDRKAMSEKLSKVMYEEKIIDFAQERAEQLQQEFTPEMATKDIITRSYILGFVDAAMAAVEKYEPQEAKQ